MKKPKIARICALEKKLTTLKKIKCSQTTKRKLRRAARDWIAWEKQHVKDLHSHKYLGSDIGRSFHNGSISMLELFFNLRDKNEQGGKRKWKTKKQ